MFGEFSNIVTGNTRFSFFFATHKIAFRFRKYLTRHLMRQLYEILKCNRILSVEHIFSGKRRFGAKHEIYIYGR